jgi:predicted nucleic acid-binding protein
MIFVDTSVWIDFLANRETKEVANLLDALEKEETIGYTGLVIQELFQGIRSQKKREQIESSFEPFIEVFPNRESHKLAAKLFRDSRSKGHPIRSSIDCLIAACCIEHGFELLHNDRDFDHLALISKLKIFG